MSTLFQRTRFIMVSPSHPGNIGSAARAIKTMGFQHLVLVSPKREGFLSDPQAIALASGAQDVLQNAQTYPSLAQALAPITLSFALSARPRDMGPPAVDIRQSAEIAKQHLALGTDTEVAVLLGPERVGLDNHEISLCHRICHIPANPEYSSLNVAQALQLAAWEWRYAFNRGVTDDVTMSAGSEVESGLANQAKVNAFIEHWQKALIHIGFLNPEHPKKLIPRMRYLFNRSQLSQEETDMMRGVCTQILKLKAKD